MLIVNKLIPQARGLAPVLARRAATVEIDWDLRQKSRFEATDSGGRQIGVFLPRGTLVRGGDLLVGEDGSLIRVVASAQPVLTVRHCPDHGTPFDLLRAAYHLGNRHVPLELQPDRLQLEPDHVLAALLRQMGLIVVETMAPFEPEGGAYAAGAAAHPHAGHAHAADPLAADPHAGHSHAEHSHAEHSHAEHPHAGHSPSSHSHATDRPATPEAAGLQPVTLQAHPQHDHGHHDLSARLAAGPPAQATDPTAPHVHGPGCGHHHSH